MEAHLEQNIGGVNHAVLKFGHPYSAGIGGAGRTFGLRGAHILIQRLWVKRIKTDSLSIKLKGNCLK